MKLYRFSPITSESGLQNAIEYLHKTCHQLCKQSLGYYLPVRGNVGIFTRYGNEFDYLTELCSELTDKDQNYKSKYFKLHKPIIIPEKDGIPGAVYDFLYIRRTDPYRSQVGDIDFVIPLDEYKRLQSQLNLETFIRGMRLFGRPEENLLELWSPDVDSIAYVGISFMKDEVTQKESK